MNEKGALFQRLWSIFQAFLDCSLLKLLQQGITLSEIKSPLANSAKLDRTEIVKVW